ncbi:MAG: hypothetical protein ACXWC8_06830 [Limisphaerales bacterium]
MPVPQAEHKQAASEAVSYRRLISSEDIASVERALRQLASLENNTEARRSLLELASTIRPVSHWGLNE